MPLFVYLGHDAERSAERRLGVRPRHLAHLEPLERAGRIRFAGPLLGPAGESRGSLIVLEAESLDAARAIADSDPYLTDGVFERVEVFETRQVLPAE